MQAAWNGYPKNVVNGIIKHTLRNNDNNKMFNDNEIDGTVRIYKFKQCMKKLYKCFKKEKRVKHVLQYETTKLSYFTNTKDKISLLSQSSVVCKFVCPGCSSSYIGKQSALYGTEGQKNMATKIIIRKNNIWESSISAKLEITQLLLTKQITGTFYFSRKHTWLKHIYHPQTVI